jgi:ADP-ribose pyrophosphatase YjhB (NUDIX family)
MNMIQKQLEVKQHCIEKLHSVPPYPDYPKDRYFWDESLPEPHTIPEGPWDTSTNDIAVLNDVENIKTTICRVDKLERPIHPWFEDLARSVGVVAGRGKYWNWGPNYTVDPIIIGNVETNPKLLLVKRNDNNKWAFPGGFLDYSAESTVTASVRECHEETGVEIEKKPTKTIYIGPVADERTTAHAWAFTNAKLWLLNKTQPVSPQIEEVNDVEWHDLTNLPENIHGSHAKIIEFALKEL